jgi:hypothetical protein
MVGKKASIPDDQAKGDRFTNRLGHLNSPFEKSIILF